MQPHQQRVVEEKAALDEKIEKLQAFIGSEQFAQVDRREQSRLSHQHSIMADYSAILHSRIAAWEAPSRQQEFENPPAREAQSIAAGDVGSASEVLGAQS